MVFENVFLAKINLETGTENEFIEKGWRALNIHEAYPEEEIGPDAFLDWARDLSWIDNEQICVVVTGKLDDDTRETIEFINEEWEEKYKNSPKECYKKQVNFILVG